MLLLIWVLLPLSGKLLALRMFCGVMWSSSTVSTKALRVSGHFLDGSVEGQWTFSHPALHMRFSLDPSLPGFPADIKNLQHDLRESWRHLVAYSSGV